MDRYQGLEQMSAEEAEHLALLLDRQEWDRDAQAVAEYESWLLQQAITEADAENIAVQE
jgi:hypothetical protein